jgi:endonuclease/exonuclease/phosphatase family metal-dependent hydrolase
VRLLTWNIQWCRGVDGKVDPARIAREARRLADPDVICFQEVSVGFTDLPGTSGEDQVAALERELPGYAVFFAAAVDIPGPGGRHRFGNVIASRLPVGRVMRHSLPWPPTSAPSMPRAALEVVVQAIFGPVRVTTTHLEYYSNRHRTAQIEHYAEVGDRHGLLAFHPSVERRVRRVQQFAQPLRAAEDAGSLLEGANLEGTGHAASCAAPLYG